MKINSNAPGEDRFFAECELQVLRIQASLHPIVKRDFTPIIVSNVLPMQFKDLVPQPEDEMTTHVEMHTERYCYFVDRRPAGRGQLSNSSILKQWISVYDYSTDEKRPLVNVSEESGVHELDHF